MYRQFDCYNACFVMTFTNILIIFGEIMLDTYDHSIIHLLASDGRMPVNELAEQVNLSPTPVTRRLKRLEQEGIITGYSALIDERRMGFDFSVFVSVRLEKQIDDI